MRDPDVYNQCLTPTRKSKSFSVASSLRFSIHEILDSPTIELPSVTTTKLPGELERNDVLGCQGNLQ